MDHRRARRSARYLMEPISNLKLHGASRPPSLPNDQPTDERPASPRHEKGPG